MRLKSNRKSIYHSTLAAVVANPWRVAIALCAIPAVAYGQAAIIPASPASSDASSVTISEPASSAMPQKEGIIGNLEFRDVSVVQLITMIAQQGNVGIIIGPDVDDSIHIPYISLNDETPRDAIRKAALAAGLKWEKIDDKTYMIGKSLPNIGEKQGQSQVNGSSTPILPFGASPQSTTPSTLPDILGEAARSGAIYTPMPSLVGMDDEDRSTGNDQPTYTMVRVHNVRPDIIAYWIDPAHQTKPPEFRAAEQGIEHAINQYPLQSGADPNVWGQLTSNANAAMSSSYGMYNPNPYANPYGPTSPLGYGANQPYFQGSAQFGNRGGGGSRGGFGGSNSNSGGMLEAPKGIGSIVSIDAQNAILIYGTADGVKELKQIIDYLDRPIRQVEIEAQFVDVGTTDASAFGLNIGSRTTGNSTNSSNSGKILSNLGTIPSIEGGSSLTATFGSYQATLRALISNKKARIVNSPRVTTLNNLTAFLFSATSTPIVLSSSTSGIGGQVGTQQNAFFLTTSIGLIVTPTINNDDTITVFLTPQVQVQTPVQTSSANAGGNDNNSNSNTASSIPSFTSQYLTTVATVKDGDTIVLGGLRTKNVSYTENGIPILSKLPLIGGLFKSKQKNDDDRELVIFLTARILHRTDDLAPLPGT